MSSASIPLPEDLPDSPVLGREAAEGAFRKTLIVTGVAAAVMLVGFVLDGTDGKKRFFFAYLMGWLFALSVSLGSLFWVMIHHVSSAGWSVGLRRTFENVTRAIPVLALLFLPIALGMDSIYKWVDAEANASDPLWQAKRPYLNVGFFLLRVALYFGVWIVLSVLLRGWSIRQDATGNPHLSERMKALSAPGILLLALTTTFAAFDLIMSLNYHWYSTIFGVYFWAGGIRGSLAACVLLVLALRSAGYLRHTITREHLHDCGKLLFGFTVFWTYIAFAQYFLIWYGNIPEETQFYRDRWEGSWFAATVALPICSFAIPFVILLPRTNKRSPFIMAIAAGWILFFHLYDIYWQVMPEVLKERVTDRPSGGVDVHWMDVASAVMFGGVVVASVLYGMRRYPIIPVRDPHLEESIHFENDEFGDEG